MLAVPSQPAKDGFVYVHHRRGGRPRPGLDGLGGTHGVGPVGTALKGHQK